MKPIWRIYYDDGSTFSSLDGDEHEAPGRGVVAIVQICPRKGRVVIEGWNWYYRCLEPDSVWAWSGSNQSGMEDQFITFSRHRTALKHGRHSPKFEEILLAAQHDPDFPVPTSPRFVHSPTARWGD